MALFLTAFIFTATVILHILLQHFLRVFKIKTPKTMGIFGIAFLINVFIQTQSNLPLTSSLIFGLLSTSYAIFFASTYLKDISPSFKIIRLLRRDKTLSQIEIEQHFTDEELIIKRLKELTTQKIIQKKDGNFTLNSKGLTSLRLIEGYRRLLNWVD